MEIEKTNAENSREKKEMSAFIEEVNDFTKRSYNRHVKDADGVSMFVCATDMRGNASGEPSIAISLIGERRTAAAGLALAMNDDDITELMLMARLAQGRGDDYLEKSCKSRRRSLAFLYGMTAACVLWSLLIIKVWLWGLVGWMMTLSNLLLMVYVIWSLIHTIIDIRGTVSMLQEVLQRDDRRKASLPQIEC